MGRGSIPTKDKVIEICKRHGIKIAGALFLDEIHKEFRIYRDSNLSSYLLDRDRHLVVKWFDEHGQFKDILNLD